MILRDKKPGVARRFFGQLPGIFSIALFLTGCAGTSSKVANPDPIIREPAPDQEMVDGQATDQQRAAINASNQRIFDTEHAATPAENAAPPTPANPQGGIPQ